MFALTRQIEKISFMLFFYILDFEALLVGTVHSNNLIFRHLLLPHFGRRGGVGGVVDPATLDPDPGLP